MCVCVCVFVCVCLHVPSGVAGLGAGTVTGLVSSNESARSGRFRGSKYIPVIADKALQKPCNVFVSSTKLLTCDAKKYDLFCDLSASSSLANSCISFASLTDQNSPLGFLLQVPFFAKKCLSNL